MGIQQEFVVHWSLKLRGEVCAQCNTQNMYFKVARLSESLNSEVMESRGVYEWSTPTSGRLGDKVFTRDMQGLGPS